MHLENQLFPHPDRGIVSAAADPASVLPAQPSGAEPG